MVTETQYTEFEAVSPEYVGSLWLPSAADHRTHHDIKSFVLGNQRVRGNECQLIGESLRH